MHAEVHELHEEAEAEPTLEALQEIPMQQEHEQEACAVQVLRSAKTTSKIESIVYNIFMAGPVWSAFGILIWNSIASRLLLWVDSARNFRTPASDWLVDKKFRILN